MYRYKAALDVKLVGDIALEVWEVVGIDVEVGGSVWSLESVGCVPTDVPDVPDGGVAKDASGDDMMRLQVEYEQSA